MGIIYAISPFATEALPHSGTVEKVIYDHFYLFKAYSDSLKKMNMYVDYLNANFDNAIDKLGFNIIHYEYPDDIQYSSGAMCEWINKHYDLQSSMYSLDVEYELCVEGEENALLGNITIMANCYAPYDLYQYTAGMFEDYDVWRQLIVISRYVESEEISMLLVLLTYKIARYAKSARALGHGCYESYDANYINEQYFVIYQQKAFVRKEIKECRKVGWY